MDLVCPRSAPTTATAAPPSFRSLSHTRIDLSQAPEYKTAPPFPTARAFIPELCFSSVATRECFFSGEDFRHTLIFLSADPVYTCPSYTAKAFMASSCALATDSMHLKSEVRQILSVRSHDTEYRREVSAESASADTASTWWTHVAVLCRRIRTRLLGRRNLTTRSESFGSVATRVNSRSSSSILHTRTLWSWWALNTLSDKTTSDFTAPFPAVTAAPAGG
nr:hypothetical protein DVH24_033729 [Ipomoea batatas]